MRLSALVVFIALFITATAFAQDQEETTKTSVSAEKFAEWAKPKWSAIQACIAVAKSALASRSEADQAKSRTMAEAMFQDIDVWNKCQPPTEYRSLCAAFMDLWCTAYNLCTYVGYPPTDPNYFFVTEAQQAIDRLQPEVVRLSPIIGGLKPLCANWFGNPSLESPSWNKVPISNWAPEEYAEERIPGGLGDLRSIRDDLQKMSREWEVQVDADKSPNWPHYFRWAWKIWYLANKLQVEPQLEPTRSQAEAAISAVYDAMTRSSQTGEKMTPEREEADRQVIALMAVLIGSG